MSCKQSLLHNCTSGRNLTWPPPNPIRTIALSKKAQASHYRLMFLLDAIQTPPKCWFASAAPEDSLPLHPLANPTWQKPAAVKTSAAFLCSLPTPLSFHSISGLLSISFSLSLFVYSLCLALHPQWWLTLQSKGKLNSWLTFLALCGAQEILCSVSFASELLLPEGNGQDWIFFSTISDLIQWASCFRILLLSSRALEISGHSLLI